MKKKYKAGDVFTIPLGEGRYSICKVLWAPVGDYKKVFSFCVLENKNDSPQREGNNNLPMKLNDNGNEINVIFTGVKKISNGEWSVISHDDLNESDSDLLYFNIAGALHKGDEYIRMLDVSEYGEYRSMSVFGFELVLNILTES